MEDFDIPMPGDEDSDRDVYDNPHLISKPMTLREQFQQEAKTLYPDMLMIGATKADALTALRITNLARSAYIAGRTKNRWIPVEERLPEISEPVIVSNWSHRYEASYTGLTSKAENTYGNPIFQDAEGRFDHCVAHWMLIPKPPTP